ncbi:MAG: four helix bundle protein [Candidatus Goldbacteria bacterium]|nr:four helix bundle protein [Candidatus Goldiibacteriota bacterium]
MAYFQNLANEIYKMIEKSPIKKDFSFKDQLKRAALYPMTNIAEGFMCGSNKEFIQFLFIARWCP